MVYVYELVSMYMYSDESNVLPICIGLVKLSDDRYIYMEDDCNSEHNFVCDTCKYCTPQLQKMSLSVQYVQKFPF